MAKPIEWVRAFPTKDAAKQAFAARSWPSPNDRAEFVKRADGWHVVETIAANPQRAAGYSIRKGKGGYSVFWKHPLSVSGWFATKQDAKEYARKRLADKYKETAYKNPARTLRFRTKAAALAYASAHGLRVKSIRKVKR